MWARHRLEWVTAVVAAVLGAVYLLLPPMGSDLAAQEARAGFFATHGWTPIDLRWYAGVDQLGYSLVSQPVMALLGVRLTGALTLVAAAVLLALLLRRTDAPRPMLGALVGAVCLAGNLVSGRVTYGLGVCLALGALLALTTARPSSAPPVLPSPPPAASALPGRRWPASLSRNRSWIAAVFTLLAGATSPVAALYLGLAGAALLLSGRIRAGLLIAVPAALPLAASALLFGDGGWMNISRADTLRAVVASLLVAALVPRRPVRIGALFSAVGVLAAFLIHTPVGLNATRLAVMFTLPLLAAYAALPQRGHPAGSTPVPDRAATSLPSKDGPTSSPPAPDHTAGADESAATPHGTDRPDGSPPAPDYAVTPPITFDHHAGSLHAYGHPTISPPGPARRFRPLPLWLVVVLMAVACWSLPPVVTGDLRDIGNPTADPAFFQPLRERLGQEQLTGRVEIPSTRDYWESAHMGEVPLARGWLRQADIDRNPLFFADIPGARGTGVALTPDSYRAWLDELAVQFVAVPDTVFTWSGRPEAALVTAGLPYLTEVWHDQNWRLYAVADPTPIVAAPATLIRQDGAAVTFDAPAGVIELRVRWHRWLTVDNGASLQKQADWTLIRTPRPGRYTLTS